MKARCSQAMVFVLFLMFAVLVGFSPMKLIAQEKNNKQQAAAVEVAVEKEAKIEADKKTPFSVYVSSATKYNSNTKTAYKEVEVSLRFIEDIFNCKKIYCSKEIKINLESLPFEIGDSKSNYKVSSKFNARVVTYTIIVPTDTEIYKNGTLELNWKKTWLPYKNAKVVNLDLDNYQKHARTLEKDIAVEDCKANAYECILVFNNFNASISKNKNTYKNTINLDNFYPKKLSQTSLNGYLELQIEFNKYVELKDLQNELLLYNEKSKTYQPIKPEKLRVVDSGETSSASELYKVGVGQNFALKIDENLEDKTIKFKINKNLNEYGVGRELVKDFNITLLAENNLKITSSFGGNKNIYPWNSFFNIGFNDVVLEADLKKQIVLEPNIPFNVLLFPKVETSNGSNIVIEADFPLNETTKITFKKGIKGTNKILKEDLVRNHIGKETVAEIVFAKEGRYLSPNNPQLLRTFSRNIDEVRLQAWELPENNLAAIINLQDYNTNVRNRITLQFSKNIFNKISTLDVEKNKTQENLINLKDVLNKPNATGLYLLKITKKGDEYYDNPNSAYSYSDYYSNSRRYLPIVITDLGLSVRELNGEYLVWVNSLASSKSVAEAEILAYDSANQIISKSVSDENGLAKITLNGQKMSFLMVKKGSDISYLSFKPDEKNYDYDDDYYYDYYYDDYGDNESDYSNYRKNSYYGSSEDSTARNLKWYGGYSDKLNVKLPDIKASKEYVVNSYEAFTFLPRGIYKPGENVEIKGIVRDSKLNAPDKEFPVIWKVYDPEENVFSQGQEIISTFGGFNFATQLPFSARSGSYKIKIFLPESETPISLSDFEVEDFMPPRLAIEAKFLDDKYYGEKSEFKIGVDVKYLFGALGTGLNYEVDFVLTEEKINFKDLDGFNFEDETAKFSTFKDYNIIAENLDKEGKAEFVYQLPMDKKLPPKVKADFLIKVQEDGGRWNAKRISTAYYAHDFIFGIKKPEEVKSNTKGEWEIAVVDVNGEIYKNLNNVKYEIYKVNKLAYSEYRRGRQSIKREVDESLIVASETLNLKNGLGKFSFSPKQNGFYIIVANNEESGVSVSQSFTVFGENVSTKNKVIDNVEITFDKQHYAPGETAIANIKAPFVGELLITVENSEIIFSKVVSLKKETESVEIPVSAEFLNQSYVTATVIKAQTSEEKDVRAIGIAPIYLNKELRKINFQVSLPERVKPKEKLPVKITLTDYEKKPVEAEVAVFLVDEGILSLTNFKSPDPFKHFYVNRIFRTMFYDFYDRLLPFEKTDVKFLKPGGDSESMGDLFSAFQRKQEMLSIFVATVKTNANGEAELLLDLPEYSGNGRLMLTAYNKEKIGNYEQNLNINRDLTVEVTTPLALAPGDTFSFPVKTFLTETATVETGNNIKVSIKTQGPISLAEEGNLSLNLKPGEAHLASLKAKALPQNEAEAQVGIAKIIVETVAGNGEQFKQTFEVAVRSPFHRVVKAESAYLGKPLNLKVFDESFLTGSFKSTLTIANDPLVEASKAVRFLHDYPYGCLEQTTSRSWVFLAADELLNTLELEEYGQDYVEKGLLEAAKRLSVMQTYSGGFAYWPNQSEVNTWGSLYAIHFLSLASKKIDLPEGMLDKSLNWAENFLNQKQNTYNSYSVNSKAYAVYILAINGKFNNAWIASLQNDDNLEPSGRIYLAGAQALAEGNSQALLKLENIRISNLYKLSRYSTFESTSRNNSLMLMVWNDVDPMSENARKWALKVADDGANDKWTNTQENGMAIFSLGTFMTKTAVNKNVTVDVLDKTGNKLFSIDTKNTKSLNSKEMAKFENQEITLKVTSDGKEQPYYVFTTWGVPKEAPTPAVSELALSRTWALNGGLEVNLNTVEDYKKLPTIKKGDKIVVKVKVKPYENINNLVLVDLVPGGFEIENPKLLPPSISADEGSDDGDNEVSDDEKSTLRVEAREDRLVIVDPWLEAKKGYTYAYTYTLRAITPGEYVVPPTTVEGMYNPQQKGVLAAGKVVVEDVNFN